MQSTITAVRSVKTSTRAVRFLGACKRCKVAGRPRGLRAEATVTTKTTVYATTTPTGAAGWDRLKYEHTIEIGGRAERVTEVRRTSIPCPRCLAAGVAEQSAHVLLHAVNGITTDQKCGAKCRNSTGPSCECACGGENHGCGHA